MMEAMTRLLQAQTDAMVAQAQVTAVQHLPNLPLFTGEERDLGGDAFDKWVENGFIGLASLMTMQMVSPGRSGEAIRGCRGRI